MNEEINAIKIAKLQHEIEELKRENQNYAKNEVHLIETISYLSTKALNDRKRSSIADIDTIKANSLKKRKIEESLKNYGDSNKQSGIENSLISTSLGTGVEQHQCDLLNTTNPIKISFNFEKELPLEVISRIFSFLSRIDLDQCQLVNKKWQSLIKQQSKKFQQRTIQCLKLIEKNYLSLVASTDNRDKKYSFSLIDHENTDILFVTMKRLLQNCMVKRWIFCNVTINDHFVRRLGTCLKEMPHLEFGRVEMLAVNLQAVSPDNFHRFVGSILMAQQYFIDGARNAAEEHFNAKLLEQPGVQQADDFTVYDVRSIDSDEVFLAMGDDCLIKFVFGGPNTPKRNTLYLDSPDISTTFLKTFLTYFSESEYIDKVIPHVEFAHCHEQHVPTGSNWSLEYEHEIQVEWSAKNKKTGRIIEARISRNGDSDNFCHLTLNIRS